jgi:hypothetical protein
MQQSNALLALDQNRNIFAQKEDQILSKTKFKKVERKKIESQREKTSVRLEMGVG